MGLDILILVNNDKPTSPRFGQTIYNNTVNFAGRGGLGTALNIMILHHYCHTSTAITPEKNGNSAPLWCVVEFPKMSGSTTR